MRNYCRRGERPGFRAWFGLTAMTALLIGSLAPARAAVNLVTNGDFATPGAISSFQFGTYGSYTPPQALEGWTSTGYNFVFLPGSTVATGYYGNLSLWSPSGSPSSANGFTNASATGGNFVAADGAYGQAKITQTINGLTAGQTYAVSFDWGGAQQSGYSAVNGTTEFWAVTFGGTTQDTETISVPNMGFSGWLSETFHFVADSPSETLSFFATGTPSGEPPFALLANVSVVDAPEPASIAGMIGVARRRRSPRKTETVA
jgi:hypothetical protein